MSDERVNQVAKRVEQCTVTTARRVAAMLNRDPESIQKGDLLARGWHFVLLGGETVRDSLRKDGFPGFGVPMPEMGLPRVVLGGREVTYYNDIEIGSEVERVSYVSGIEKKTSSKGPFAIVKIHNELRPLNSPNPSIIEKQTYYLLSEGRDNRIRETNKVEVNSEYKAQVTPDDTLLFQYSALGFNSHKIHLDREYAKKEEGFPDLVVNGGLITLLITEFARLELGLTIKSLRSKHLAPLYSGHPMTIGADHIGNHWDFKVYDYNGSVVATMEVEVS